jgi:hypothetical protein
MGLGFILLTTFAVLAIFTRSIAGAIATGVLVAVSAAPAGYISRTFVRSQEAAAANLHAYFGQPLEFSRYLAAERLVAASKELNPEQRARITTVLAQTIAVSQPIHPQPQQVDGAAPPSDAEG